MTTDHDNTVPWHGAFDMRRLVTKARWHQAAGATKHQRFAEEARVEHYRTIHVWNTALVGTILNTAMHTLEHPLWIQQTRWQRLSIVKRRKAQHIRVEQETTPFPRPKGVAIDSHNAGDGPAIGVEGRRGIVRFDLHDQVPLVIQLDHTSVVMKHRDQPVDPLADFLGSPHNKTFKETANNRLAPMLVTVLNGAVKNFVLAVLRPGL